MTLNVYKVKFNDGAERLVTTRGDGLSAIHTLMQWMGYSENHASRSNLTKISVEFVLSSSIVSTKAAA